MTNIILIAKLWLSSWHARGHFVLGVVVTPIAASATKMESTYCCSSLLHVLPAVSAASVGQPVPRSTVQISEQQLSPGAF